jgi:hypothetical protein
MIKNGVKVAKINYTDDLIKINNRQIKKVISFGIIVILIILSFPYWLYN